jgi:beta-lactamase superfamily II metal-dependent hydrolase
MSSVHFLNVGRGDCIVLEHASGRASMYDICAGNQPRETPLMKLLREVQVPTAPGNFGRCEHPTNPLDFLRDAGIDTVFRFILSHPDCDHLDGFDALLDTVGVLNFWHTGVSKAKPAFGGSPFREEDWDRYERVRDGLEAGTKSLLKRAGDRFKYANATESGSGGDGLYILAPDDGLVEAAELTGDYNDASYVILYRSIGGRVLIPGDAHDKTWEFLLAEYAEDVEDVDLLIAPHHGRKSGRDYSFLNTVRPKLTLFGCAPSDALAYDAWRYRGLKYITNNQAGSITVDCQPGSMSVFIENRRFVDAAGGDVTSTNTMGFYHLGSFLTA